MSGGTVEAECLRTAVAALSEMRRSPYDPDRENAKATLAQIEQKLRHGADPDAITVTLLRRDAEVLVSQPKDRTPGELGRAREPLRKAIAAHDHRRGERP